MRLNLAPKISRSFPAEYYILKDLQSEGAVIGHWSGRPIVETVIDQHGLRYNFAGIARTLAGGGFDVEALRTGEWIVEPGLIYRMEMTTTEA